MYVEFVVDQLQKCHVFISVNDSCKASSDSSTTVPHTQNRQSVGTNYGGTINSPPPGNKFKGGWLKFCLLDCFDGRLRLWNNTHDESWTLRPGTCVKKANGANCDFLLIESVTQSTGRSQQHSGKQHICTPALFVFLRREHEAKFLRGNFSLTSSSF